MLKEIYMSHDHHYKLTVQWTGNTGSGTSGYRNYERSHLIIVENKPAIGASSDPAFRGDPSKHNPEELFLASVASCHMLWYLHFCADAGIIVTDYVDHASAVMAVAEDGNGRFVEIKLNPVVTINDIALLDEAHALHKKANEFCFIANTLSIPVLHNAVCRAENDQGA